MTNQPSKQQQVERLIVLLNKIEKQLADLELQLNKLEPLKNNNPQLYDEMLSKKERVLALKTKITKAKLNLNYYFI